MRIISGKFKGRFINFIKNSNTRPLKDSVKENIFNILNHSKIVNFKIEGSNILDLYSGIGSFGIECMSRGANKVTFVEHDKGAIKILSENVKKLSILNKIQICSTEIEIFLNNDLAEKFDIFFLDPPFSDSNFLENLKLIKSKKIFMKKHIVVIHREIKTEDNFRDILETLEIKQYGRSKIIFGLFK